MPLDHEQTSLLPSTHVHLRIDLYAIGPANTVAGTVGITEGLDEAQVALHTFGCSLTGTGERDALLELGNALHAFWRRPAAF